jgi:hypothetical protein
MNEPAVVREVADLPGAPLARWQQELAEAMTQEADIARDLREALIRQRAGVAGLDNAAVESSVDEIAHLLLTLEEAARRRAGLMTAVTGRPDVPIDRLETVLATPLQATLLQARQRLRRAAQDVAQEVAINRNVLRRAAEAGEAFVQALFSSVAGPAPAYGQPEHAEPARTAGMLVNRRA